MRNNNRSCKKKTEIQDMIKIRKENLAKSFFDLSKLTFAALVLGLGGALLNLNNLELATTMPNMPSVIWYIFFAGLLGTVSFAFVGCLILK